VIGEKKVIMRREGDKVAACLFQRDVAIGVAEIRCLRQVEPSDARIVEPRNNFAGVVGAAIADDQRLKILLGSDLMAKPRKSAPSCVGKSTLKCGATLTSRGSPRICRG
jgi:hypothetical protein